LLVIAFDKIPVYFVGVDAKWLWKD